MKANNLIKMLEPFNISDEQIKYDYSEFLTEATTQEPCPDCGNEIEAKQDGTSNCSECGHKNVLPCTACPLNDQFGS